MTQMSFQKLAMRDGSSAREHPIILDVEIMNPIAIQCLLLHIMDTSGKNPSFISNITGYRWPFSAAHLSAIVDDGSAPNFRSFCEETHEEFPVMESFSRYSCARRTVDNSYSLESGFTSCQCDRLCPRFGDCCFDYEEDDNVQMSISK